MLIDLRTNNIPMATWRDVWPLCSVVKDYSWAITDELTIDASISFESRDKEDNHRYETLFDNHPKETRVSLSPRSLLKMRIEKGEVRLLKLRSSRRPKCNQSYNTSLPKKMAMPKVSKKVYYVGVRKALFFSRLLLLTRHHSDFEFLDS